MLFLFHTIIHVGQKPVYWNVYKSGPQIYFFEVQENSHNMDIINFELDTLKNKASVELPPKELQRIVEEIDRHNETL